MKKDVRISVWLPHELWGLAKAEEINFTSVLNECLSYMLDLPPDPRLEIMKQKMNLAKENLRAKYAQEIAGATLALSEKRMALELERAKIEQRDQYLLDLGKGLQKITSWPHVKRALEEKDAESDHWESALYQVNKLKGFHYKRSDTLWNDALDWWVKFGKTSKK